MARGGSYYTLRIHGDPEPLGEKKIRHFHKIIEPRAARIT
jgi:hypothetical protein